MSNVVSCFSTYDGYKYKSAIYTAVAGLNSTNFECIIYYILSGICPINHILSKCFQIRIEPNPDKEKHVQF